MNYTDLAALMTDAPLRSRIKVACLKFADFILNQPPGTPARNARIRWANGCQSNPEATAAQAHPVTVMDPKVMENGTEISDADLQAAVETAIERML